MGIRLLLLQYRTYKIVYRRYAGLFFSMCIDVTDNELTSLEAIHLFVEILDHYFSNGEPTCLSCTCSACCMQPDALHGHANARISAPSDTRVHALAWLRLAPLPGRQAHARMPGLLAGLIRACRAAVSCCAQRRLALTGTNFSEVKGTMCMCCPVPQCASWTWSLTSTRCGAWPRHTPHAALRVNPCKRGRGARFILLWRGVLWHGMRWAICSAAPTPAMRACRCT